MHSKLTVLCLKCSYWEIAQYRLIYINGSKNAGSGVCHLVINMPFENSPWSFADSWKPAFGHCTHIYKEECVFLCLFVSLCLCVCIRVCLAVLKNCFHFRTSHLWWLKLWITECFGDGLKHFSLLNTHI